jgi:hypothetical protein
MTDDDLLAEFRSPGLCECCGVPCLDGRDPAHIYSRGAGRADCRENLVSLSRECHTRSHGGHAPRRWRLLIIAARREGTRPKAIRDKVYAIRRDNLK